MYLILFAILNLITAVSGANDFVTSGPQAFPSFFAADELTAFYWTNIEGYIYTLLATNEDATSGSYVQLLPYKCGGGGGGPVSYYCDTTENNGSALFGLGETDGLQLGYGWQFSLQTSPLESWNDENAPVITTKLSPTFTLLSTRPEPSTSTSTTSTTSTTSSTTSSKTRSTSSSVKSPSSAAPSTSHGRESSTTEPSESSASPESTTSTAITSKSVSAVHSKPSEPKTSSAVLSSTGNSPEPEGDKTHSGGDRLSPGAIAGIVIGVIIFILLVLAAVLFLWRRRRSGPANSPIQHSPPGDQAVPDEGFEKPELETTGNKHEMMATPIPENMIYHAPEEPWHERYELSSSPAQGYVPPDPADSSSTQQYSAYHQQYQQYQQYPQQLGSPRHEMSATPVPGPGAGSLTSPTTPPELSTSPVYQAPTAMPAGTGPQVYPPRPNQEDEIRRLEEEERELDLAIAENERLQRLREEKERVRRRIQEVRYGNPRAVSGSE